MKIKKKERKQKMKKLKDSFFKFYYLREGSTLIEIALYIALVVIVCVSVVATLGDKLQSVFQKIVDSL